MAAAAVVTWLVTAVGGLVLLAAWGERGRARTARESTAVGAARTAAGTARPESAFPLPVVVGHVIVAVATVVLALLTVLTVLTS